MRLKLTVFLKLKIVDCCKRVGDKVQIEIL